MRIVDLFSGAGGLTFGFYYKLINDDFIENENCEIVFANEWDKCAAEAFRKNFPSINMINKDIKSLTEEEIRDNIANKEVDLIIGGPPCQSYSTIGKRKYDDKAKMYQEYYRNGHLQTSEATNTNPDKRLICLNDKKAVPNNTKTVGNKKISCLLIK